MALTNAKDDATAASSDPPDGAEKPSGEALSASAAQSTDAAAPAGEADREGAKKNDELIAVAKAYASRRAELGADAAELAHRSGRVSALRGLTFLATAGAVGYIIFRAPLPIVIAIAAVAGAAFVGLVIAHAVLITREAALEQRIGLVDRAIARISHRPHRSAAQTGRSEGRQGAGLLKRGASTPIRPQRPAPPDHPYAKDLDIFGERSLFEILDTTQTEPGESTLAAWLSAPSSPSEITERNEAVRELSALHRFREDLALEGLIAETQGRSVDPLIAWAEAPPVLAIPAAKGSSAKPPKRALIVFAAVFVVASIALFSLDQALGAELPRIVRRAWIITLAIQTGILAYLRTSIEPLLATAASKQAPFGRYQGLFRRVEEQSFRATRLASSAGAIRGASGEEASKAMRSLESIIGYADLRHNGLIYLAINVFLLWDVWCALALDRWRARAGGRVRAWFEALGEIEALSSLATYAYERPDHTFPDVVDGPPSFEARGLGHPMIPPDVRVANDVSLASPGSALLVTGSNMSGKSTLLRAMGINAVLAQAGAPVCAERLRMSTLAVRTSMRIDDSLEQGISHFYAELARLKAIVDDSKGEGARVFFLLDEILHGTNSRERHIGAKAVVLHLLDRGSIGAVSSHDLALADLAEASGGRVKTVHFEEIIRDGRMAFDYVLKPGVVTTTNALRLMRLVGLDIPGIEGEAAERPRP